MQKLPYCCLTFDNVVKYQIQTASMITKSRIEPNWDLVRVLPDFIRYPCYMFI